MSRYLSLCMGVLMAWCFISCEHQELCYDHTPHAERVEYKLELSFDCEWEYNIETHGGQQIARHHIQCCGCNHWRPSAGGCIAQGSAQKPAVYRLIFFEVYHDPRNWFFLAGKI